jgi:hypothetical protein
MILVKDSQSPCADRELIAKGEAEHSSGQEDMESAAAGWDIDRILLAGESPNSTLCKALARPLTTLHYRGNVNYGNRSLEDNRSRPDLSPC